MADQKMYDMVVTVGSYKNREGVEKKQYETVGTVFQGQNGMYAVMKKTFNPAGVPSDRSSFFVSFYEPKEGRQQSAPASSPAQDFNDDLPF